MTDVSSATGSYIPPCNRSVPDALYFTANKIINGTSSKWFAYRDIPRQRTCPFACQGEHRAFSSLESTCGTPRDQVFLFKGGLLYSCTPSDTSSNSNRGDGGKASIPSASNGRGCGETGRGGPQTWDGCRTNTNAGSSTNA
eukprot:9488981-Pyramimonas_sp.AAC.1